MNLIIAEAGSAKIAPNNINNNPENAQSAKNCENSQFKKCLKEVKNNEAESSGEETNKNIQNEQTLTTDEENQIKNLLENPYLFHAIIEKIPISANGEIIQPQNCEDSLTICLDTNEMSSETNTGVTNIMEENTAKNLTHLSQFLESIHSNSQGEKSVKFSDFIKQWTNQQNTIENTENAPENTAVIENDAPKVGEKLLNAKVTQPQNQGVENNNKTVTQKTGNSVIETPTQNVPEKVIPPFAGQREASLNAWKNNGVNEYTPAQYYKNQTVSQNGEKAPVANGQNKAAQLQLREQIEITRPIKSAGVNVKIQDLPEVETEIAKIDETQKSSMESLETQKEKPFSGIVNEYSTKEPVTISAKSNTFPQKMAEIITKYVNQRSADRQEVEISLIPKSLGKVEISLRMENGKLQTDFSCSPQAAKIIKEFMPDLRVTMEGLGIMLGDTSFGAPKGNSDNSYYENYQRGTTAGESVSEIESNTISGQSEATADDSRYSFLV